MHGNDANGGAFAGAPDGGAGAAAAADDAAAAAAVLTAARLMGSSVLGIMFGAGAENGALKAWKPLKFG